MKITLVNPPSLIGIDSYSTMTQPPLGIAYLAAFARQSGHDIHVVDAVGEAVTLINRWPFRKKRLIQGLGFAEIVECISGKPDVIGISCMFTHAWPMIRELIIVLKKEFPEAKLIAGGEHVSAMYEMVLKQSPIDTCVIGEGEETLVELLEFFQNEDIGYSKIRGIAFVGENGEIIKTDRRKRITDLDKLPWPAWDLADPMRYMASGVYMGPVSGRSMPILATRGCPFGCTFCPASNMWERVWRARDYVDVADEIVFYMEKYQASDFQLQDLTAIVRKDWIIAFCREIIKRKLNITWQLPVGTRSEVIDKEVVENLMASGCRHITYAPESGSERILKLVKKKVNLEQLELSAKASLNAGMTVCLFNVIGFPQEEMLDIMKTFKWLRHMAKVGVHEVTVSTFIPVPGAELFHEIDNAKPIVLDDDYCYSMTGITSMLSVRSWNPGISNVGLLFLKLSGLAMFYGLSFCYNPGRLWRLLYNLVRNKQETKVDRVIREFINKIPVVIGFSKSKSV